MLYFEKFSSNTYAGSGNQLYFTMQDNEIRTGRVLYKISVEGEYDYSILFSNIMDSTYADGSVSHKNLICSSWKIHNARIGKCKKIDNSKDICQMVMADEEKDADIILSEFKDITFNGEKCKVVMPGEFFSSDPLKLSFNKDEYLCLEMSFSGKMIPYHEESLLPAFVLENGSWKYSKHLPFAGMVGCDRKVKKKIAFLGDSITQGIGMKLNSYLHWNALLSKKLGCEYSFWNLGIGFGRAEDAASDGAWLYKAKQNDIIFVCYGVNDIYRGRSEEQIKKDLTTIVDILKNNGKKVILQTIPPFDYEEQNIETWNNLNACILNELKMKADYVFDNRKILCDNISPEKAKYGGHPNEEGCALWADALFKELSENGVF